MTKAIAISIIIIFCLVSILYNYEKRSVEKICFRREMYNYIFNQKVDLRVRLLSYAKYNFYKSLNIFIHLDRWHLFANSNSLIILNPDSTSLILLYFLCHIMNETVLLISTYFTTSTHIYCSIGFSGILFAFDIIQNKFSHVLGQLILVHVFIPNASIYGHVSGILAGLILKNIYSCCKRKKCTKPILPFFGRGYRLGKM